MIQTKTSGLVLIKALSIGRGDGPGILRDILEVPWLHLRRFREWQPCATTIAAMADIEGWDQERLMTERGILTGTRKVWICEIGSCTSDLDAYDSLDQLFGPEDMRAWVPTQLRYRYSFYKQLKSATHPTDTVVHLVSRDKADLIGELLF